MLPAKLICPQTELDINKHWIHTDKVYISCVCITYNQELYIKDAIESFLAQETEYRFEIIIHDDVSTDCTRNILSEYKAKYPSIIKLVLQEQNQYALGKKIIPIAVEHATGRYIAICEGDDYWIDEKKLQKQILPLIDFPNLNFCFTKAIISEDEINTGNVLGDFGDKNKILSSEVLFARSGLLPTASYFFRYSVLEDLPGWFYDMAPVGDVFWELFSAGKEGGAYIASPTAVYRKNAIGSWTSNISNNNEKIINKIIGMINCFKLALVEKGVYVSEMALKEYISARYIELCFYRIDEGNRLLATRNLMQSLKYKFRIDYQFIKAFIYIFLPKSLQVHKLKKLFRF